MSDARLVAVTADPELVASFVKSLGAEGTEDVPHMDDRKPLRLITGDET